MPACRSCLVCGTRCTAWNQLTAELSGFTLTLICSIEVSTCACVSRHRRWHVHCAGMGVPALEVTAVAGRSFCVPARPYPRNGHAVGDAEMPKKLLGGNCKTSMVVCVSPQMNDANETSGTLEFGRRCTAVCLDMRVDMCTDMRLDIGVDMCMDMCLDKCLDMCLDKCLDMCLHMCRMCMDMRVDMCTDMCMDMCLDMCLHVCLDMCRGMCSDMRVDMCTDMCMDMRVDMCLDMCMDMCMHMCMDMCMGQGAHGQDQGFHQHGTNHHRPGQARRRRASTF